MRVFVFESPGGAVGGRSAVGLRFDTFLALFLAFLHAIAAFAPAFTRCISRRHFFHGRFLLLTAYFQASTARSQRQDEPT